MMRRRTGERSGTGSGGNQVTVSNIYTAVMLPRREYVAKQ